MTDQKFVNNDFSDVVLNRHSVREFEPNVKISRDELQQMIAETIQAPSACNLQSWHFVVVDTPEGKAKLKEAAMKFNYPQVDTASAIIYLAGDTESHLVYRDVWNQAVAEGRITPEKRDEIFSSFLPLYENATPEFLQMDATIDCSMAAMQLLQVIRAHGYDANAWAGYDPQKMLTALGLDQKRFVPVMAISLGKSAEVPLVSTRYPASDVTEFL
ncbi:NAD(P)H-dependent quinone reductase [Ligilactobacillus pabuli]|uniref:NAD(P)H-dependent quinone reductase n=1 Tax=Ligilactobacillus pabuli TaxID=2886039 RepID=A0ABQ5JHJ3_9LACO|nr:nitroreductase family protein [Ligilactobacillus pabuli]GKS81454.1 NAD(P)H-dependent quinone reductase [Ligilactobacillus pabuli]